LPTIQRNGGNGPGLSRKSASIPAIFATLLRRSRPCFFRTRGQQEIFLLNGDIREASCFEKHGVDSPSKQTETADP
jgi:hypothetical protein